MSNAITPEVGDFEEYQKEDSVSTSDSVTETTFEMMVAKVMDSNSYKPTEAQFDMILKLKSQSMEYDFKQKTQVSPQRRFDGNRNLILTVIVLVSFLFVFTLVLAFAPEHVDKLISLFAGLLGGYGVGKSNLLSIKKDTSFS